MLPFDDYLFDEDGNRVVISISKLGREMSGPRSDDLASQSRDCGPMDRAFRDLREEELERQRRTLREFRFEPTIDSTTMQIGEEPPMVNFPNEETVTIRLDNGLSFYVPRTDDGAIVGKLIREAAINGLLDIDAIQIVGCLQDKRGSSLTRDALSWIRTALKMYLGGKFAREGIILDLTY